MIGGVVGVSGRVFLFFGPRALIFTSTIFVATTLFAAVFSLFLSIGAALLSRIVAVVIFVGGLLGGKVVGKNVVGFDGRGDRDGFRGGGIRWNGPKLDWILARGGEIVRYSFVFVETDLAGVGANETFVEDAAGELIKVFVFEGSQHARADFRGFGDGIEIEPALFALFAKFFSERSHVWLRRRG